MTSHSGLTPGEEARPVGAAQTERANLCKAKKSEKSENSKSTKSVSAKANRDVAAEALVMMPNSPIAVSRPAPPSSVVKIEKIASFVSPLPSSTRGVTVEPMVVTGGSDTGMSENKVDGSEVQQVKSQSQGGATVETMKSELRTTPSASGTSAGDATGLGMGQGTGVPIKEMHQVTVTPAGVFPIPHLAAANSTVGADDKVDVSLLNGLNSPQVGFYYYLVF